MAIATFLPLPNEPGKRVELFFAQPSGGNPNPALIYVHGHQIGPRPGGRRLADEGYLDELATAGVVGIALSQPGYGNSDGPPDYCGPRTHAAIRAVLQYATRDLGAAPGRIALVGGSRGAIAGSVVATQTDQLGALVLSAGAYDFAAMYRDCPLPGIQRNIEQEAGTTAAAFAERTSVTRADLVTCPVLIMHGAKDDRISPRQAEMFATALEQANASVTLKIFLEEPHRISHTLFIRETHRFINESIGTTLNLPG